MEYADRTWITDACKRRNRSKYSCSSGFYNIFIISRSLRCCYTCDCSKFLFFLFNHVKKIKCQSICDVNTTQDEIKVKKGKKCPWIGQTFWPDKSEPVAHASGLFRIS